jgi:serine/threonine protein kinase
MKTKRNFEEEEVRFIAGQLIQALFYVHSFDVVFGDLNPDNVLLN